MKNMSRWRKSVDHHPEAAHFTDNSAITHAPHFGRVKDSELLQINDDLLIKILQDNKQAVQFFCENARSKRKYRIKLGRDMYYFRVCQQLSTEFVNSCGMTVQNLPEETKLLYNFDEGMYIFGLFKIKISVRNLSILQ
jgi:hypothetical protein